MRGALSSLAVRIYLAGIALISFAILTADALNPRGRRGVSWFDDFTLPVGCAGFVVCIIAPFFAHRRVAQRIGFSLLGAVGFAIAVVIALTISTIVFGLPDQD